MLLTITVSSFREEVWYIQCEVNYELRENKVEHEKFAKDIAECILKFISPYIFDSWLAK